MTLNFPPCPVTLAKSQGVSKTRLWPLFFQAAFPDPPGWISPPTLGSHGPPMLPPSQHPHQVTMCLLLWLPHQGASQELDLVGGIPPLTRQEVGLKAGSQG